MEHQREPGQGPPALGARIAVWDLATRLFHWSLVLCTVSACISAELGGDRALRLHFLSGYAILILVGFRILWGFAGPRYARFDQFVRGPASTLGYAARLLRGRPHPHAAYPGHNPLGALSVLALLAICAAQAASGLFANDEIASEGPLAHLVSQAAVGRCTALHAWGQDVLYALVALHLCAVAFYRWARDEDLLAPMLSGRKILRAPAGLGGESEPVCDDSQTRARALLLLGLCAALVAYVVHL